MPGVLALMSVLQPRLQITGGLVLALDGTAPYTAAAQVTFNSNGTLTVAADPIDDGSDLGSSWYPATVTGIGDFYWVRMSLITGVEPSGPGAGWHQLNSSPAWTLSRASVGLTVGIVKFEFATDSGGVNVVYTSPNITFQARCT